MKRSRQPTPLLVLLIGTLIWPAASANTAASVLREFNTRAEGIEAYKKETGGYWNDGNSNGPVGQCVWFVRCARPDGALGKGVVNTAPSMNALEIWKNAPAHLKREKVDGPAVGAIMCWGSGNGVLEFGHVAIVTEILPDGKVHVWDSNFSENFDKKIRKRLVDPSKEKLLQGYILYEPIEHMYPGTVKYPIVSLCVDRSGSMNDWLQSGSTKWDAAVRATYDLLRMLDAEARSRGSSPSLVDLILFDDAIEPMAAPNSNYDVIRKQLSLAGPRGGTNITEALSTAIRRIGDPAYTNHKRVIILLTDGVHNVGTVAPTDPRILQLAKNQEIEIYTIGFGERGANYDEQTLQLISSETGGKFFAAKDAHLLRSALLASRHQSAGQHLFAKQDTIYSAGSFAVGEFNLNTAVARRSTVGYAYAQVPVGAASLLCTLIWDKGDMQLHLVDPAGKQVVGGPNDVTDEGFAMVIVNNPKPGLWKIALQADNVPSSGTRYDVQVSGRALKDLGPAGAGGSASSNDTLPGVVVAMSILVLVLGLRYVWVSGRGRPKAMSPSVVKNQVFLVIGTQRLALESSCVLGSDRSCGIRLHGGTVSKKHALLYKRAGHWWIRDLGSASGTIVNSRRVVQRRLNSGDVIQIGANDLRFIAK